ncbi:MAG: nitrous oxide reductase accessory protein NosL [Rhodobacteraceae bacterium]|nr:nitrous oxide reductase accessory protein NosL [Paracoccaceae bacterium]
MKKWPILLVLALVAACDKDTNDTLPAAQTLNDEAAGYYCQMIILDHPGPKGQLFLDGMPAPIWFSQVRDGLAYLKSSEQEGEVLVLYVNDMGLAASYDEPGPDNWINAADAFYVVGSDAVGGMGAPELVPFGTVEKAQEFAESRGGTILTLDEISAEMVLAPVEITTPIPEPRP